MTHQEESLDLFRRAMDLFVSERSPNIRPELFSELFERLIWLEADNGEAILTVLADWLMSDDTFKIWVALGIQDVFLFRTKEEMLRAYAELSMRMPEVRVRCDQIVEAWNLSVHEKAE